AWLRVPASELVNRRVPLEAFWGAEARGLADWASEGRSPEDVALRLEAALSRRGASVRPADAASSAVYRLLSANLHPNGRVVDRLADQLGLSPRTLRRRCHEAFGYGPKTLDRILRFQRFLRLARAADPAGTASLAAKAGYADQAHLTRETQRLAGLTPIDIRGQLSS
ncbi:MAG: helix-turn-helix domain-containing protein, partial [Pseudonocardiaceae bacterium]